MENNNNIKITNKEFLQNFALIFSKYKKLSNFKNDSKKIDFFLNKEELNFFDFLNSKNLNKEEKISQLFILNKYGELDTLLNDEKKYYYLEKNDKDKLKEIQKHVNDFKQPILDFFTKEKVSYQDILLFNQPKKYNILDVDYENEDKNKKISGSWFAKIKDKSFEEISAIIDNLKENDKLRLIKILKSTNYGFNPLTSALINSNEKVFEYILNVYKELNINLQEHQYIEKDNYFKIKNKRVDIFKNQSLFDFALSHKKIKSAKLLEENNMNVSKIHPLSGGGLLYYLYDKNINDSKDIEFTNNLINYVLSNYSIDYLFLNFKNKSVSQDEFIDYFYFTSNFDFLTYSDEIFNKKENQEKYFNFLIKIFEIKNKEKSVISNFNINRLMSFFHNIDYSIKSHTIYPELFKKYRNFCLDILENKQFDNETTKNYYLELINNEKNKSLYEKSLLNEHLILDQQKSKEIKKFKL